MTYMKEEAEKKTYAEANRTLNSLTRQYNGDRYRFNF